MLLLFCCVLNLYSDKMWAFLSSCMAQCSLAKTLNTVLFGFGEASA